MSNSITSERVTHNIRVRVIPAYIAENSRPEENKYFFAYTIQMANEGDQTVQLLTRHWIIINADGDREDVQGDGVIGKTPVLEPGESFEYMSFCPLNTPWGTMEGTYQFINLTNGEKFDVIIDRFILAV
jgi:ApaG protein